MIQKMGEGLSFCPNRIHPLFLLLFNHLLVEPLEEVVEHCFRLPSMNEVLSDEALPSTLAAEEAHCSACASIVMLGVTSAVARIVATANTARH